MSTYPNSVPRTQDSKAGERPSIRDYGAIPDCTFMLDGAITAASNSFVSASSVFVNGDIGKTIWIEGAGAAGVDLVTTIQSVVSPTNVLIVTAAGTTVSGARCRYGTDNTSAIQLAFDEAGSQGWRVEIPRGAYLTTASLVPYDRLTVAGEGYEHSPSETDAPQEIASQICCVEPVPVIDYQAASPRIVSLNLTGFAVRGTAKSGSKGVHISDCYGLLIRDVTCDYFGDQAIHVEFGVDAVLDNIFIQNAVLVRSGRTEYIGALDTKINDAIMTSIKSTASVTADASGWVAGIVYRAANGFMSNCFGHISEVGIVVSSEAKLFVAVNCRTDQNLRHGWVVDASVSHFIGCRAHSNSEAATGTYDGFLISGGGNRFVGCLVSWNSGANPQHLYGFEATNSGGTEANHFNENNVAPGSVTSDPYKISGTQVNQMVSYPDSLSTPGSRKAQTFLGDVLLKDDRFLIQESENVNAGVDEKYWYWRTNYGPGFAQYALALGSDDFVSSQIALLIGRTGTNPDFVRCLAAYLQADNQLRVGKTQWVTPAAISSDTDAETGYIEFGSPKSRITFGTGDPENVIGAVGGSLYLRANSASNTLYVKVSGTAKTGWKPALLVDLEDATYLKGTGLTAGEYVKWTGTIFQTAPLPAASPTDLGDAADVDGTGLGTGRNLAWDGTKVVNGETDVNNSNDIAATGFSTNQYPRWDGTRFVGDTPSSPATDLGDAADVDGTGLTTGKQLQWDGSKVVNATAGDFDSLDVGGGDMTVDASGNTDVNSLDLQGAALFNSSRSFFPREYNQATEPVLANGELGVWVNSTTGLSFICYRSAFGTQLKVALG